LDDAATADLQAVGQNQAVLLLRNKDLELQIERMKNETLQKELQRMSQHAEKREWRELESDED
jgi:hypothetical protein